MTVQFWILVLKGIAIHMEMEGIQFLIQNILQSNRGVFQYKHATLPLYSHYKYKDKMVSLPSNLYNMNSYTGESWPYFLYNVNP